MAQNGWEIRAYQPPADPPRQALSSCPAQYSVFILFHSVPGTLGRKRLQKQKKRVHAFASLRQRRRIRSRRAYKIKKGVTKTARSTDGYPSYLGQTTWLTEAAAKAAMPDFKDWVEYRMNQAQRVGQAEAALVEQ